MCVVGNIFCARLVSAPAPASSAENIDTTTFTNAAHCCQNTRSTTEAHKEVEISARTGTEQLTPPRSSAQYPSMCVTRHFVLAAPECTSSGLLRRKSQPPSQEELDCVASWTHALSRTDSVDVCDQVYLPINSRALAARLQVCMCLNLWICLRLGRAHDGE